MAKPTSLARVVRALHSIVAAMILLTWAGSSFAGTMDNTAVGTLKSKDHLVELHRSPNGPLYTVKKLNGDVVAELLSADDLLSQFPSLESLVRGIADDASLHPMPIKSMDVLEGKH